VVLFAFVVMTVAVVAMLVSAADEAASSSAQRESALAFYAAEAGLQDVWGHWPDDVVDSVAPGDTLTLHWRELGDGSSYRAHLQRVDSGSWQPLYLLTVEGRSPGIRGARKTLQLSMTVGDGGRDMRPYELGSCCRAAVTTRSEIDINRALVSGIDRLPTTWDPDRCEELPEEDVPGIIADDTTDLHIQSDATWEGDPPLVLDPTMNDSTFTQFGDLDYDQLRAAATTHLENWSGPSTGLKFGGDPAPDDCREFPVTEGSSSGCWFGPRYNLDGTCDTSHPLNFGAPDGPCKDHFPVVLVSGDWAIRGDNDGYAQGIFVMDTSSAGVGSEFDIEGGDPGAVVAGLIIGKGCVEIDEGFFYGAMFIDGTMTPNPSCNTDEPLSLHSDTGVQYSSCVLQSALGKSGVGLMADPLAGGVRLLHLRAYNEPIF
jgi:hypothetical protein